MLGAVANAQPANQTPAYPMATQPAPVMMQAPPISGRRFLSDADTQALRQVLDASRRGDAAGARNSLPMISDPVARKIGTWAFVDAAGEGMSFFEADQARRDLAGWPRAARRNALAERKLETAGLGPQQVIDWFAGGEPQTPEGAMALAGAYRVQGKLPEAEALIRRFWREKVFEAGPQQTMIARFGDTLTLDDHAKRADMLLYSSQGPASRMMIGMLAPDQRAAAEARLALRANSPSGPGLAQALPGDLNASPGVAFERAAYLRRRGMTDMAMGLAPSFPKEVSSSEMADRIWDERYQLVLAALRSGDSRAAYQAAANSGLKSGGDAADAEFYAGWIALTRLKNPAQADVHFAALEKIGASPITRGRALYWRGRAAEARGDKAAANGFYGAAARFNTTFYGQLAGEKVGDGRLTLAPDPQISAADRARFDGRDSVQAARMLYDMGERDLFKAFVLALDDVLPTLEEQALLVDLARGYGDQDTSMKVVRTAAQRGFILTGRGYPLRTPPSVMGAPEPALVLGITRQESGFDPLVRSGVGARGMMQLMPATASIVARNMGVGYQPGMLDDPDYNMRLGSTYLRQVIDTFSGSYVMGVASYNAGPGRPAQWVGFCGDPRGATTDPIDFIECIPFSETRNYVMRVLEGMQVYRAKLNGGTAPITLSSDLRRGGYGYAPPQVVASTP
ncbi:lytic transglycosylase domain-containing protein [Phenylobacterium sp.]|uniref:lytic transglycosylase domain-containing protein n=1 Tax=Phenylobacterium sp. TaxID=1871053 RepID=UPI002734A6A5|nr:lytic transglycosylase domain-containing protein [Phenylobacterium sp.]MDP3661052.1 lytic transglycosylase domain-containing protein [Phenylobacterium sp.]